MDSLVLISALRFRLRYRGLRLLVEGPHPRGGSLLVSTVLQMRWTGGDWALIAPPGGDWRHVMTEVRDTTGYTPLTREGT